MMAEHIFLYYQKPMTVVATPEAKLPSLYQFVHLRFTKAFSHFDPYTLSSHILSSL